MANGSADGGLAASDAVVGLIRARRARVVVLGQGYVGLVLAMRASEAGFDVVGFDTDQAKANSLRAGCSYIEDVSDDVLGRALARGYVPTSDAAAIAGFDVAVISVPTPLRDGLPDLSFIEDACRLLAPHLRPCRLVVLESTTYPGTTEEVVGPVLQQHSPGRLTPGRDFLLGYSPERIDPGNTGYGLHNTPKIVSGVDAASLDAVEAFFSTFVDTTVPVATPKEAELAKVIENTFRHVNIALANEIAMFGYDLGIDVGEAIDAAATKPFGFMKFTPGPGVGGHCLPIDPSYLSWRVRQHLGESFRFIELANDINAHMPHYVVKRITALLNRDRKAVNGARIVLLGISYKPDVGDAREAPALAIIEQLLAAGATVDAVDPHVSAVAVDNPVTLHRALDGELLDAADLVVIVTDHDAFDYDLVVRRAGRVLDTRGRLPSSLDHVERL